ncbi:MAG TPA: cellulase family glycosylhydrolase [Draconibacterium sp.]|nr:cellulase family glycosylhydrolase [Draconibacterium sp.]
MFKIICFFIAVAISVFSCNSNQPQRTEGFISVEDQKFVDANGTQVILNGINYISKSKDEKYLPQHGAEIFQQFASWGFNCIRLGIIWDGLEPEPGKYNEEYLAEIDKRIQWAGENGIYVFLDMHQDLYGSKFSDGAPEWATLDEGQPHHTGAVWSDSYLISPAVQTAFDNFWKNALAPDGIGLQDHYANLWKYIAKRYASNTTVIGYDIMNEPFMGTSANNIMPVMLGSYAQVLVEETGQQPPTIEELAAMWGNEESRLKALEFISTKDRYARVIDGVYELNAAFEKNELQAMYQKVANAIRQVDKNHILFLEHSYFSNTGVASAIEPVKLADGSTDPQVAYAAHGYDLVVDTKEVENPSFERVEFIFDRINQTGQRMKVPMLIGEWGAFSGNSLKMAETAQHFINVFESYNFSNTYWAYSIGIEEAPYFKMAIVRPYPVIISGQLISYDYDFNTGAFTCEWEETENMDEPTVVYVPNLRNLEEKEITINPQGGKVEFEYFENSNAGEIYISSTGKNTKRRLNFSLVTMKEGESEKQ